MKWVTTSWTCSNLPKNPGTLNNRSIALPEFGQVSQGDGQVLQPVVTEVELLEARETVHTHRQRAINRLKFQRLLGISHIK